MSKEAAILSSFQLTVVWMEKALDHITGTAQSAALANSNCKNVGLHR